jgi:hypothetical protein
MRALCVLTVASLWWVGCDQASDAECAARSAAAPLFGAERDSLGVREHEEASVVALSISSADMPDALCTGALVAPNAVLTARHCAELFPEGMRAYFGEALESSDFDLRVLRFEVYDDADLALAFLEQPVPSEVARPLALWSSGDDEILAVGNEAILSGYGLREDNGFGVRELVSEPIVELSADEVVVDGGGQTGACVGDSGGPLLLRDAQGRLRVVGVLSVGSASCLDLDVYVRLEPARDWLEEQLATTDACSR